jgi:thioesterase domain-containing protein
MEMAQQLTESGENVTLVALIDTFRPGVYRALGLMRRARYPLQRLAYHVHNLRRRDAEARSVYFREKFRNLRASLGRIAVRCIYPACRTMNLPLPEALLDRQVLSQQAAGRYTVREYRHKTVLFRPEEQGTRVHFPQDLGWSAFIPQLKIAMTPGDHITMLLAPSVSALVRELESCMEDEPCRTGETVQS